MISSQILRAIKKNEMDVARSTCGGEVNTGFWWVDLRETDHLEHLGRDCKIN